MSAIDEYFAWVVHPPKSASASLKADAVVELELLRAKAAFADAMWHHLDTINRPLDEYEGQWYVRYEDEVKP